MRVRLSTAAQRCSFHLRGYAAALSTITTDASLRSRFCKVQQFSYGRLNDDNANLRRQYPEDFWPILGWTRLDSPPIELAFGGLMVESHPTDSERYVHAGEVARVLGCSQQTVINMIKDGRLSAVDRGQGMRPRWLITSSSLASRVAPSIVSRSSDQAPRIQELEREVRRLGEITRHLAAAVIDLGMAVRAQTESGDE